MMKKQIRNTIALLLVLMQLFVLFPVLQPQAQAAETTEEDALPVLNPVIEGTVRFGSFNYLGDKDNNRDGVDYVSTFYYSDDYFSRSAVNPKAVSAGKREMNWTDLEDLSMATLSKDFTIACFGSSENTFPEAVWTKKDKNGLRFLKDCEFDCYESNSDFKRQTGADTIGAVFGSKEITVYDQVTGKNDTFTLIAIGVRGAGYGAEWASNLTIGNPATATKENSGTYRHNGFQTSANQILDDLDTFMTRNGINPEKAKYWICGYSRAGAVANLVAGKISDNGAQYHTRKEYVFGYTYEAAAGALNTDEPNVNSKYPNIHNIINKMDAVPLVSPALFNHVRLGVDYLLPYYNNTTGSTQNTSYYNRMYTALKNVAAIADLYNKNKDGLTSDHDKDPTLTDADPLTYPYKNTIQLYEFGITSGGISEVENSRSEIAKNGFYMDRYLSTLVDLVMNSRAWDVYYYRDSYYGGDLSGMKKDDWQSHEAEFVSRYQNSFRYLAWKALEQPGMGISSLDGMIDKALNGNLLSNAFSAAEAMGPYMVMSNAITDRAYGGAVNLLISPMTRIANNVVENLGIFNASDLSTAQGHLSTIMPVLTWLYCEDHRNWDCEYLGTLLGNVSKILVTHIPELGVSWLMSLDDVFISDYREITLPKNTAVSMKVVREGIDYTADSELQFEKSNWAKNADVPGAEVAAFVNGVKTISRDDRITVADGGNSFTIRYPGNLDVRFEVKAVDEGFADVPLTLADFTPGANVVNVKSTCTRAGANDADGLNESNIKTVSIDHAMTTQDNTPDANTVNGLTAAIPLSGSDTLHIMSWHGSNQVAGEYDTTYYVSLDKAPRSVVAEYTMETVLADNVRELPAGTDENLFSINDSNQLVWSFDPATTTASYAPVGGRTFTAYNLTGLGSAAAEKAESVVSEGVYSTRQTVSVVPAASIYYDDTLLADDVSVDARTAAAPDYESVISALMNEGTEITPENLVAFKFTGTRIDLFMNTDQNTGGVAAYLLNEDGTKRIAGKLVAGKSDNALCNVPVVSFKQYECKTYTVAIVVGEGKSFQLDGVRIYDETRASYAGVREALLSTADWTGEGTVSGTVYLDYQSTGDAQKADYTASGPKGEVYLKQGNGVAFAIADYNPSASYRIGLGAADGNEVTAYINGEQYTVSSATHMFYDLHPNENGFVVISGVSGGILSVTDVEAVAPVRSLRLMASPALMRFAASLSAPAQPEETAEPTPEVTPEVTPEPTPEATPEPTTGVADAILQLISSFVQSLFGSISRLFG